MINEFITILICLVIALFIWRLSDVIKHFMTIKARERSDKAYEERKKKELEARLKKPKYEDQVKNLFGNDIEHWFVFNGKHFWITKGVFGAYGVAYGHSESAIRNKTIKSIHSDDNKKLFKQDATEQHFFCPFTHSEKKQGYIEWDYIPINIKFEDPKPVKTDEEIAEDAIKEIDNLLNKN